MPEPGCSARWSASQASRCCGGLEPDHAQPQRLPVEASRAAPGRRLPSCSATSAVTRALAVAVVASTGMPVGQVGEQGADAAVVGAEVVAPVGDAVRLVDHQQAAGRGQPGQHLVAEAGVVEPLGADQQHVDLAGADRVVDRLPLLDVGRVDGDRADAGALGGRDLVAHQGEQRRDDDGRARRPARAAAAWRRSRPPTCPSRCAARPARGGGRRPAPRSRSTGPRAARRRRGPPARAGAPRPGCAYGRVAVCHGACLPAVTRQSVAAASTAVDPGPQRVSTALGAGAPSRPPALRRPGPCCARRRRGHRLAQLGEPVVLVLADQAHAPGQRVGARAGDAGVDEGVEDHAAAAGAAGSSPARPRGSTAPRGRRPTAHAPRDLGVVAVLGLAGDLHPLPRGSPRGTPWPGRPGPRRGATSRGVVAQLDVGDGQHAR